MVVDGSMSFDCFLSYRVKTDKERVRAVYDCLSVLPMDETSQPPRVFFDSKCLENGQQWDVAFCEALTKTNVFVALISEEAVQVMAQRPSTEVDNVALEWALALEVSSKQWQALGYTLANHGTCFVVLFCFVLCCSLVVVVVVWYE
jgi:hypothetical protein